MNNIKQALESALEALETLDGWLKDRHFTGLMPKEKQVVEQCKAALKHLQTNALDKCEPQQQWVGLSNDYIDECSKNSWVDKQAFESVAWWAEAKLKELNT